MTVTFRLSLEVGFSKEIIKEKNLKQAKHSAFIIMRFYHWMWALAEETTKEQNLKQATSAH